MDYSDSEQALVNFLEAATSKAQLPDDELLDRMERHEILHRAPRERLRWFFLLKVEHAHLNRVFADLSELLDPLNSKQLISLVGMTGIGKTTLGKQMVPVLKSIIGEVPAGERPVIFVEVKSIGDAKISWRVLYREILCAAGEVEIDSRYLPDYSTPGYLRYGKKLKYIEDLFQALKPFILDRNVKVLILDEAVHLLRYEEHELVMDTLKTLALLANFKIVLIGSFDIVELVGSYAQVSRRNATIHYRRYVVGTDPGENGPLTADQMEFRRVLAILARNWPCQHVPNFDSHWYHWMHQSMGSIGLLKISLMRLAILQANARDGKPTPDMLRKVFLPPGVRADIEKETCEGEQKLVGLCYGDCNLDDSTLTRMCSLT